MNTHDVIVCVHNGKEETLNCLESLIDNWSSKISGEIIIIDDASSDDTCRALSDFANANKLIRIHRLPKQSYYTKAANAGLKQSTAKYRTLLNSDTVVTSGWREKILSVFQSCDQIGIVGPLSNAASTQSVPHFKSGPKQTAVNLMPPGVVPEDFSKVLLQAMNMDSPPFVPLVHGFCMTVKSDVIDVIGLLDEDLFPNGYGEENDYCFRADDAGFILAVAVNAFVYHRKSVSYSDNELRVKFMNSGMTELVKKYGSKRIEYSVAYMEANPVLMKARESILNKWFDFYSS